MKLIVSVSSLTLVLFSSVAPCLAANQAISRSSEQTLPRQSLPSATKATVVAGFNFGGLIDQGLGVVKREQRRKEEEERKAQLEKERQEREAARKKRQEELQAARKAATEQQRLEADRRRQYFESLSPAEKEAYLTQQRKQQEANKAAWLFVLGVLASDSGGSAASQQDDPNAEYRRYLNEENDRRIQRENDAQHRKNIGW